MSASQRGVTVVSDRVAAKIARQACAEITVPAGGHVLHGTARRTGRSVEVTVDVELPLTAPGNVERMADLHRHLTRRTGYLTGADIAPAYIRVRRLTPEPDRPRPEAMAPAPFTAHRPWSPRRAAAAGLGTAACVLSVLLLWTVCRRYVPGVPPPPWKQVKEVAHASASLSFVPPAVVVVAAAAAGVWLILLALTPGHRRALALGCPQPVPVRARTTRTHAARLARAALAQVPGLRVRSVRFTPRTITVRAHVASGRPQELREAAAEALSHTIRSMAPAREPRVRIVLAGTRGARATGTVRPGEEGADA
ncbi:DUF6286 domain-containing protein [Streptomyces bambusae]|uniref:DUF6286 domain-containing protein n=1 Tax=Streptomyces bambusae TaxID=1550616 RepID=UPI001CFFE54A|nr:DUF6286 domain-containing protein [Streptomyces bambusae]MCB5169461.1 DUF6286 domain-containing protein [Streptomyces bambusae]